MPYSCEQLLTTIADLGICTSTIEHPPLRTVEEAQRLRGHIEGAHVKNLFLKDKQKRYWLIVALEDTSIDLKATATVLGAQKFSFASAEELLVILGIVPGAVSPLAVINDIDNLVSLVLDKRLIDISPLNFHPLRNDRTTAIATTDFLKFLEAMKHTPQIIEIPQRLIAASPDTETTAALAQ
jgi:Ala-tRNA(Pro) deacylase